MLYLSSWECLLHSGLTSRKALLHKQEHYFTADVAVGPEIHKQSNLSPHDLLAILDPGHRSTRSTKPLNLM